MIDWRVLMFKPLILFCCLFIEFIALRDSSGQISLKDTSDHGPEIEEIIGHYISLDTKDTFDLFLTGKEYHFRLVSVDSQGSLNEHQGRVGAYYYASSSDAIFPPKTGELEIVWEVGDRDHTEGFWVKKDVDGVIELSPSFKLYKLKNFRKTK